MSLFKEIHKFSNKMNIDLNNKSFLDVGTGNGMIPRLMCSLSGLSKSSGADPFLDGEHATSWQKHDHDETLRQRKQNKGGRGASLPLIFLRCS